MDLSKLPKLSQTSIPPREAVDSTPSEIGGAKAGMTVRADVADPPTLSSPVMEAWVSIGVGAFLWLFQPRLLEWISSRVFHTHFDEFVSPDAQQVAYTSQPAFWSDLGPTMFGLVLIMDGIVLAFVRRPAALWVAWVLTVLTTIYNFAYLCLSYRESGLAPISFLASVFGAYIAHTQWRLLKRSGSV